MNNYSRREFLATLVAIPFLRPPEQKLLWISPEEIEDVENWLPCGYYEVDPEEMARILSQPLRQSVYTKNDLEGIFTQVPL